MLALIAVTHQTSPAENPDLDGKYMEIVALWGTKPILTHHALVAYDGALPQALT